MLVQQGQMLCPDVMCIEYGQESAVFIYIVCAF